MSGALDTDWRDECVQEVLKRSTGDYIFSMEPDFIGDWDKIVDFILNKELFFVFHVGLKPQWTQIVALFLGV